MKHYDVIVIGTGSGLNIVSSILQSQPELTFAIIENEAVGGICLTRGCIPSKLLQKDKQEGSHPLGVR